MDKERLIPRMFHRRLLLLLSSTMVVFVALGAQLIRLTVFQGAAKRQRAEARLDRSYPLPTTRGAILDRNGERLAVDTASYDIAVDYSVIGGAWVIEQAVDAARDKYAKLWNEMGPDEREAAVVEERGIYDHQVEQLWDIISSLGRIDRAELDLRLDNIRKTVEKMAAAVWDNQRLLEYAKFGKPEPGEEDPFDARPILEQEMAHVILPRVSDGLAIEFKRLAEQLPGLHVQDSWRREYPWLSVNVPLDKSTLPRDLRSDDIVEIEVTGVADHIIGLVRDRVYASDIVRKPYKLKNGEIDLQGYLVGDSVGSRGLEKVYENQLRGFRGIVNKHLNTGEEERIEPLPGKDFNLSIDIRLQARIQAIMSPEFGLAKVQQFHAGWYLDGTPKPTQLPLGTPLKGAVVVIEVDTGEILAMVSMPTIAIGNTWPKSRQEMEFPFVNRAVETPYPPGSIIKPFVLAAAVGSNVHSLDDKIECTGHFFPNWKDRARCWIYREVYGYTTHTAQLGGPLDAIAGLARSCNIYFYTLANKLGAENLISWYRDFGMGQRLNIGLIHEIEIPDKETGEVRMVTIGEHAGMLPSADRIKVLRKNGQLEFETVIMGIGQGEIAWTPVQAVNAYATLARGGYIRDATILKNDNRGSAERRSGDLNIGPRVLATILEGLRQSVTESYGTGHGIRYPGGVEPIINAEGVTVWAKTGTAQAPPLPIDDDGDGKHDRKLKDLDHSWFVGLVGGGEKPRRPEYAIAVILEYGGSGGRAAGPIANQAIHALITEGYLKVSNP